jgi:hypothetical protein
MARSGYVTRREHSRDVLYKIVPEMRNAYLQDLKAGPLWCNWITVGGFLEKTWAVFDEKKFIQNDPMVQSIKVREVFDACKAPISRSGLGVTLDLPGHLEGEEYVAWAKKKVREMMKELGNRQAAVSSKRK